MKPTYNIVLVSLTYTAGFSHRTIIRNDCLLKRYLETQLWQHLGNVLYSNENVIREAL